MIKLVSFFYSVLLSTSAGSNTVSFFGLNNGSGQIWSHEFKKTLFVISLFLLFVIFFAIKFRIDTKGDS